MHRQQQFDAARAATDHGDRAHAAAEGLRLHLRPGGEEGGHRLDGQRELRRAGHAHIGRGPHVERHDVERFLLAGAEPGHLGVQVEPGDAIGDIARAGPHGQRRQLDVGFAARIVSRHEAGQHARVAHRRLGRDEGEHDPRIGRQREAAQHLDVRMAAADQEHALRPRFHSTLRCGAIATARSPLSYPDKS